MKKPSLQHKTVRPGSLSNYAYYYSNHTAADSAPVKTAPPRRRRHWLAAALVVVVLSAAAYVVFKPGGTTVADKQAAAVITEKKQAAPAATPPINHCAANTVAKALVVSISARHMWACEAANQVYDSKAVTGNEQHAATLTPVGTYKIYGKQTDTRLTGSDETGTWDRPVSYWMPFLYNQYGAYGFHDATWRNNNEFGNIDPNSDDASHGCVELPLTAQAWIYNWAPIGTTVVIKD